MLKRILVAVDGSSLSIEAAKLAMEIAGKFGSEVYMIHVVHSLRSEYLEADFISWQLPGYTDVDSDEWKVYGKQIVDKVYEQIKVDGVNVVLEVGHGNPAEVIADNAKRNKADMIIMGNRGMGALKGSILGSVSQKVSYLAHCPLLIYKR